MKITVTKPKEVEYDDGITRVWYVKADSKQNGKRVTILHNMKTDHVELKVLDGSGRTKNFKVFAVRQILPPIIDKNITEYAISLAEEYFG